MKSRFLFLLILITFSCNSQNNDLYEFDPRSLDENEITLAEIADDINYIPMDNRYPIGYVHSIKIANNSIFLNARDGIIAFNRDGKMARKIGNKGRGPGEYIYSTDFDVDDKQGKVYIKDRGNIIKIYSSTGDYLRSISLQKYGGNIDVIEFYDSKLFVSYFLQFGDAKYNWIIVDTLGNLIKKKERTIPIFISNWLAGGGTYKYENKMSYWNPYNDTVFLIFRDLGYKASFLISPGEHRLPRSQFDPEQKLSKYMRLYSIFETNQFLVIRYNYDKKAVLAFIAKKSWKSFLTYFETDDNGGIINELDGGTMFQPNNYFVENGREYLFGLINPYQIKARVASSEFKNSTPKYPEKKKELEKLASSLKETDNPVLMMVRLKK